MRERQVRNTTKDVQDDHISFLVEAMAVGSSNAIERQERNGQTQLVNSDVLPTKCGDWSTLESFGVKRLHVVSGDEMFTEVELPAGWSKKSTDHSMWSKLVDDKGRNRASIFYKAAFYDRSAHMHVVSRFSIQDSYVDGYHHGPYRQKHVTDGGEKVFESKRHEFDNTGHDQTGEVYREASARGDVASDAATAECEVWLVEKYPNWKDASAHWGDD